MARGRGEEEENQLGDIYDSSSDDDSSGSSSGSGSSSDDSSSGGSNSSSGSSGSESGSESDSESQSDDFEDGSQDENFEVGFWDSLKAVLPWTELGREVREKAGVGWRWSGMCYGQSNCRYYKDKCFVVGKVVESWMQSWIVPETIRNTAVHDEQDASNMFQREI